MKMEVDDGCTKCDVCRKKCPEDIKIYEDPNARDCIRCFECTDCKHIKVIGSVPIRANGAGINITGEQKMGLDNKTDLLISP